MPSTNERPAKQLEEAEPIDMFNEDGPYFAMGRECPEGELARPGVAPSCEPTCKNPNPICVKLYFMDYVPCFCKEPTVRDESTGRCVQLSECPATKSADCRSKETRGQSSA